MAGIFRLVWFCDDFSIQDQRTLCNTIQQQAKDERFSNVANFLNHALAILDQELCSHYHEVQQLGTSPMTTISDVLEVASEHGKIPPTLGGALQNFLLVVLKIALYIGSHEADRTPYTALTWPSLLVGLSAGMLPAAAVATATCLPDLAIVGAEAARVAFRIGVCIHQMSALLEPTCDAHTRESWVYVVTSLGLDEVKHEIASFNHTLCNEGPTRLYISAVDASSVTVTGPPSRLKQAFYTSAKLRYARWTALPVYDGLAHAPHLYSAQAVAQILQPLDQNLLLSNKVVVPLLSSHTGQPFTACDGRELLTQVTSTLLLRSIHLDDLQKGVLDHVLQSDKSALEFCTFETCRGSRLVMQAVENADPCYHVKPKDLTIWTTCSYERRSPRTPKQSKLAVVGMSCRMPGGADDPALFWKLLIEGRDTCGMVPSDRFDLHAHFDPTGKVANTTKVQYGNFIDEPGKFDAAFFNMSPREADNTDPGARLALVTAYEALEMAGYAPNRTRASMSERVGTYLGQASDDWRELNASQNINAFIVPGGVRAFANGRINYVFGFGGPSLNIDTACSSGLAAVQAACSALWANEVDMALAGGLNVITDPDNYCGLGEAGFLSLTGQCKVWDETADGYCRADGVGTIVIKRLEDAEADNDNIIAVILSGATNHSANAPSITHPDAGAQSRNYLNVTRDAGIDPYDVSYVELHGTGTQAGDAVEAQSIENVFAPPRPKRSKKLLLGAVKSNIGHGEAAAGIASMIKALLCFQHNTIPAHIGIRTNVNPNISRGLLGSQNAVLVRENTPWPRPATGKRLALVNSFGAHGGNTTLLLEDAPRASRVDIDPRKNFPIIVSAKSRHSLTKNLQRLQNYLDQDPGVPLGDISYTLSARRMHHNLRVGTTSASLEQVRSWLATASTDTARHVPVDGHNIVFAFTGQGGYYEGIATQLIEESSVFRDEIGRLNQIAIGFGFPPVALQINGQKASTGAASPIATQLTITIVQIALVRFLAKLKIIPSVVVGHSLGEYAALVASGILSAADAIMLVGKRACMLQECVTSDHGLLSIRFSGSSHASSYTLLEETLNRFDDLEVSCINDSRSWTIGGRASSLARAQPMLEQRGFMCATLDVAFAFHTSQMDPILDGFESLAETVSFRQPQVPYLSPLVQRTVFDAVTINANYLRRACREPVNFRGAVAHALSGKVLEDALVCEIGPHPTLLSFARDLIPEVRTFATLAKNEANWTTLTKAMVGLHCAGVSVSWREHFAEYEKAHRLCSSLPAYAWNDRTHWIPYHGHWTLDKALRKASEPEPEPHMRKASLSTTIIHSVLVEEIHQKRVEFVTMSDLTHPDLRTTMTGHLMNKHGIASSSVWCEMALAVGTHVFDRLIPATEQQHLTILDLQCFKAQILLEKSQKHHWIRLEATTMSPETRDLRLRWFSTDCQHTRPEEPFATCVVTVDRLPSQQMSFSTVEHLIRSRLDALDDMVLGGSASRLSKDMAYKIFCNVVQYSNEYQGMESVVISGYEAYADIRLHAPHPGKWHTPPCWIDSVSHIAGLVMNGSEQSNTCDYFWVTPGFGAFTLTQALEVGTAYRSYVKMAPTEDPNLFAGDVFIMSTGQIIGWVKQIKFKRIPRVLMDEFFSPPSEEPAHSGGQERQSHQAHSHRFSTPHLEKLPKHNPRAIYDQVVHQPVAKLVVPLTADKGSPSSEPTLVSSFIRLLATETGMNEMELGDDRKFMELGVDSLLSLVLTTRLRDTLGLKIKHSVFLEHETIGEMKLWLATNF